MAFKTEEIEEMFRELSPSCYLETGSWRGLGVFGGREKRQTAKEAGYMELQGAAKDADCEKVRVDGGVSSELGCCNEFQPEFEGTQKFSCGTCEYKRGAAR
jgi:hypothetical protein